MNRLNRSIILILTLIGLSIILAAASFAGQFKVVRIYDGDTLKAESQGYEITVRLVGIDAPETSKKKNEAGQPFSQKSRTHLMRLVHNKMVDVESYGLDRYSRVLAVVYVDGQNVNLEMIKEGLAEVYRGQPAKGLDLDTYREAETKAKEAKLNMWSLGDKYVSPREWRKNHK